MNELTLPEEPRAQTYECCGTPRPRPSKWLPVQFLLVATLAIWAAFSLDGEVIRWVNAHQNAPFKHVAGGISHFGDWPDFMVAGLACLGLLLWMRQRRWARIVCIMLISTTLAGGIANSVRVVSGRPRPNAGLADGWYGIRHNGKWLISSNKYHAFPSGHTATAFAFFLPLLLLAGARVGTAGLFYASVDAGTRIYLGVHHLSDVTVSVCVAVVVAVVVCRRLAPWLAAAEATQELKSESRSFADLEASL